MNMNDVSPKLGQKWFFTNSLGDDIQPGEVYKGKIMADMNMGMVIMRARNDDFLPLFRFCLVEKRHLLTRARRFPRLRRFFATRRERRMKAKLV